MAGDMVIKGSEGVIPCQYLISTPIYHINGRKRGVLYWTYRDLGPGKKKEIGWHDASCNPDAWRGYPNCLFPSPAKGIINGINLSRLWDHAGQTDHDELEKLIQEQTSLKDKPDSPLFTRTPSGGSSIWTGTRHSYDRSVCRRQALCCRKKIIGTNSIALENGLDLTEEIVGDHAIWPGNEGTGISFDWDQIAPEGRMLWKPTTLSGFGAWSVDPLLGTVPQFTSEGEALVGIRNTRTRRVEPQIQ